MRRLGHITATHSVASEALRSQDFRAGTDADTMPMLLRRLVAWSRDLLSQLVMLEDEGQRLHETELRSVAELVLATGFETVNLLSSGIVLHPEQRERPRRHPTAARPAGRDDARRRQPRTLFERFPDLTAAPGRWRTTTRVLRGWKSVPVSTARVPVG